MNSNSRVNMRVNEQNFFKGLTEVRRGLARIENVSQYSQMPNGVLMKTPVCRTFFPPKTLTL